MGSLESAREQVSLKTIFSEPKGHFMKIWNSVKSMENFDEVAKEFAKSESNYDHVRITNKFAENIQISPLFHEKSEGIAREKKEQGNAAFKKKNFAEALRLYNQGVSRSPISTKVRCRLCIEMWRYGGET